MHTQFYFHMSIFHHFYLYFSYDGKVTLSFLPDRLLLSQEKFSFETMLSGVENEVIQSAPGHYTWRWRCVILQGFSLGRGQNQIISSFHRGWCQVINGFLEKEKNDLTPPARTKGLCWPKSGLWIFKDFKKINRYLNSLLFFLCKFSFTF